MGLHFLDPMMLQDVDYNDDNPNMKFSRNDIRTCVEALQSYAQATREGAGKPAGPFPHRGSCRMKLHVVYHRIPQMATLVR